MLVPVVVLVVLVAVVRSRVEYALAAWTEAEEEVVRSRIEYALVAWTEAEEEVVLVGDSRIEYALVAWMEAEEEAVHRIHLRPYQYHQNHLQRSCPIRLDPEEQARRLLVPVAASVLVPFVQPVVLRNCVAAAPRLPPFQRHHLHQRPVESSMGSHGAV